MSIHPDPRMKSDWLLCLFHRPMLLKQLHNLFVIVFFGYLQGRHVQNNSLDQARRNQFSFRHPSSRAGTSSLSFRSL